MTDLEATRREWHARCREMARERVRCQVDYVASLTDAQLAAARAEHMPSSERKKKKPITGREHPETLDLAPRAALYVFRWRIWVAAGRPGRSDELIEWEKDE